MTCRNGSTLDPLMKLRASRPMVVRILRGVLAQGLVTNQDRVLTRSGLMLHRSRKASHPYNLIPADDDRPESPLGPSYVMFLQQLLDLLGGLGMGRPKSVSCTPVPHS